MIVKVKFSLILFLLTVLFVSSCSKKTEEEQTDDFTEPNTKSNVKYIRNSTTPLYKNFNLKINKLYSISGDNEGLDSNITFTEPYIIKLDNQNNIYIVDFKTSVIKKFDDRGKFETNIGNQGQGPGEFKNISHIEIKKDTLYVYEYAKKLNKFNPSGEFLYSKTYGNQNFTVSKIKPLTDSTMIGYTFSTEIENNEAKFTLKTSVLDFDVNELRTIYKTEIPFEDYLKDKSYLVEKGHLITSDMNKTIYIANRNKENYTINAYNDQGDKKFQITKNYRKIKLDTKAKTELKEVNKKSISSKKDFNNLYDYKPAIFNIFTDKNDNLWVTTFIPNLHNRFEFDIFDKSGIYIGNYIIDASNKEFKDYASCENLGIFFENDLLIVVDYDYITVNVFDYEIDLKN